MNIRQLLWKAFHRKCEITWVSDVFVLSAVTEWYGVRDGRSRKRRLLKAFRRGMHTASLLPTACSTLSCTTTNSANNLSIADEASAIYANVTRMAVAHYVLID